MSAPLKVFSGMCCKCDVGISAGHVDVRGIPLHTGDIVHLFSIHYPGTDLEQWTSTGGLTAVVCDQYVSYSDGSIKLEEQSNAPFVMGIKGDAFDSKDWAIEIVKKFSDVIEGERWPEYGFSYQHSTAAEQAKAGGAA